MEKQIIGRGILAGALAGLAWHSPSRRSSSNRSSAGRSTSRTASVRRTRPWNIPHGGGGHEHGVEAFTRGVQSNIGMGLGVLAFSVAMGALLAVVFCVVYGRTGLSARALVVLTAARHAGLVVDRSGAEVPAQSACRQPRRDDQAADVALPAHGGAVGRSVRRGGLPGSAAATQARRLERNAGRGRCLPRGGGRGDADPARRSTRHPGRCATTRATSSSAASPPTICMSSGSSRWVRRS